MCEEMEYLRREIQEEVMATASDSIEMFLNDEFQFTYEVRRFLDEDFSNGVIPSIHRVMAKILIKFSEILYESGKTVVESYADNLPDMEKIRFYDGEMKDYTLQVAEYVGAYIESGCYQSAMYARIKEVAERLGYCMELDTMHGISVLIGDAQNLMPYDFSVNGLVANGYNTLVDISIRRKGVGLLV